MRDTKLIFIEGLPGSGKTTTARILATTLAQRGIAVSGFIEDEAGHPLNVGGALHPAGRTTGAALFARYTPDAYVDESLRRWRAYVTDVQAGKAVQILESYPYQNSVRVLLQMDDTLDNIRAYASAVEELTLPLRPVLVYFERGDLASGLEATSLQRGPEWTAYATELVIDCPYARCHGLRGIAGVLTLLSDYKALVEDLRGVSRMPRLVLTDCAGQWDGCHRQILEFLEI